MHKLAHITLSIFFSFASPQSAKYDELFAEEYKSALNYTAKHVDAFKSSATKYNNDPRLLTAIVFPELMRYSLIKDVLETSALELAYIEKGCEAADFSIGRFQMKPSFAEDLEHQVEKNDSLKLLFPAVIQFQSAEIKKIRKERLKRLTDLNWQLTYLNCFARILEIKFRNEKFTSTAEKIRFYSTAYNAGYHKAAADIIAGESAKYYPYGARYKGNQYAYGDVAAYFHDRTYTKKSHKP